MSPITKENQRKEVLVPKTRTQSPRKTLIRKQPQRKKDKFEIDIHSPEFQPIVVLARLLPEQILLLTGKKCEKLAETHPKESADHPNRQHFHQGKSYKKNTDLRTHITKLQRPKENVKDMADSALELEEKVGAKMENRTTKSQGHASSSDDKKITLLSLHDDVFLEILSYLSYDEVAKLRLVGRHFNEVCQKILNKGFLSFQRYHSRCLKEVKAKLPRRESERRLHPLANHIDILKGIEIRLSHLSTTYYKYAVAGMFCFIPGKVLDECYRVLREVVVHKNPPKSYELLQELRDISSMAVEHFKEHIDPTMKRNQMINTAIRNSSPRFIRCVADADDSDSESTLPSPSSSSSCPPMVNMASRTLNSFVRSSCASPSSSPNSSLSSSIKIELVVQQNRLLINSQKRQIVDLKTKVTEYGRKIAEQDRKTSEQDRKISEQDRKTSEQDRKIAEQDRLLSEYSRKLIQLEQKISNSEAVGVHVQPVVTPPPSSRKRQMKVERTSAEEFPTAKRKKVEKTIATKESPVVVKRKVPKSAQSKSAPPIVVRKTIRSAPVVKREIIRAIKREKSATTNFTMALRNRKN